MKKISNYIISKRFLHGWSTIYVIFLLYNVCSSLFHQNYLHSPLFADLFINYQGGFIRRGLLGELLLFCHQQGINPFIIALCLSLGCYAIIASFLISNFKKRKYEISVLTMTFLLGGLGANGIEFYRRDFIILSIFLLILQLWKKTSLKSWIIIGNLITILTILCYEPFIFISIPTTILLTYFKNKDWKKSICYWMPSIITFGIICLNAGGKDKYDAIVASTSSFLETPGVMSFLLDKSKDVMLFHLHINFISGNSSTSAILVNGIMLSSMTFYFINAIAVYTNNRQIWEKRRYLLSIFLYMILFLSPMFTILSIDCARTYMYVAIGTYIIYFTLDKQQLNQLFPQKIYNKADSILSISDKILKPTPAKMLFIMLFIGLSQCSGMGIIESIKSAQLGTIFRTIYHAIS